MSAHAEKIESEQIEVMENSASSQTSDGEKGVVQNDNCIPNEARDEDVVTLKTWAVIVVCSWNACTGPWLSNSDPLRFVRSFLLGCDNPRCHPDPSRHTAWEPGQRGLVDDGVGVSLSCMLCPLTGV